MDGKLCPGIQSPPLEIFTRRFQGKPPSLIQKFSNSPFLKIFPTMQPQSNLDEKVDPSILKEDFSSRTDPSIFISIARVLLDQSNQTI